MKSINTLEHYRKPRNPQARYQWHLSVIALFQHLPMQFLGPIPLDLARISLVRDSSLDRDVEHELASTERYQESYTILETKFRIVAEFKFGIFHMETISRQQQK